MNAEASEAERYRFADLAIDVANRTVTRGAENVVLAGLSFDLLIAMLRLAPRVAAVDELMDKVWTGRVVNAETVAKRVELVREALGDDGQEPRYIAVVRGRGYRLLHGVEKLAGEARHGPQGPPRVAPPTRRRRLLAWGLVGAASTIALAAWILLSRSPSPPDAVSGTQPSLAVLPFRNLSDDAANVYFSEGIAEELLGTLARVPGLRVASRTSSFSFRDGPASLPEIARALGVDHIVEGSVRKAGNRIRVIVQLIDVRSDSYLWSETYDRELADVLAIQQEIAVKIATALKVQLRTAGEVPRGAASAASLEAYQLYLRGRQLVQLRMEPNLRQAIGLLERSIDLDPLNAMAHAELASAYALTVHYYRQVDGQFLRLATERAHHALQLDPNLSLPHAVLGTVAMSRQQWREAERSYRRAIELSANDAQARYWLGELYMVMGRSHAALETIYEAFTLDPILAPLVMDISTLHLHRGNLAEACRFAERTTKLTANGYAWLGWARCLRSSGDVAGAERAEARAEQNFGFERPVFSLVHAALRDRTRKPAALAAIAAEYARQSAQFQLELIALEEYDAVFDALESNLARFNYNGLRDLWATESRGLRAQPRFRELAMRHGMLDFWRTSGWPDVCRPVGDSFACD